MSDTTSDLGTGGESAQEAARLAVAVLDAEAEREAQQAEASKPILFADELLPGVGDKVTLREAVQIGGVATFVVLMLLNSLDELEAATLSVLAPDIRDSFGVSNGVIVFLASAAGAFLVLGALPMGWLADRFKRPKIIGWASLAFAVFLALCGAVANVFQLFWARLGVGVSKANTLPVHGSMIADTYPIGARGRVSASMAMAGRLTATLSPVIVAGIASLAGGDNGWRYPFFLLGIPTAIVALLRVPAPGAAPRPVREEGRARRGDRGQAGGLDLGGGRVRTAVADPHAEDGVRGVRGDGLRALHQRGAREPVHGGPLRHEDLRAGRARHDRRHRRADRPPLLRRVLRPSVSA